MGARGAREGERMGDLQEMKFSSCCLLQQRQLLQQLLLCSCCSAAAALPLQLLFCSCFCCRKGIA